jgi:hypothetical protein
MVHPVDTYLCKGLIGIVVSFKLYFVIKESSTEFGDRFSIMKKNDSNVYYLDRKTLFPKIVLVVVKCHLTNEFCSAIHHSHDEMVRFPFSTRNHLFPWKLLRFDKM